MVAPLYNKNVTSETTGGVMASYTWTAGQDAEDRLIDWDSDTGEERDWDLSLVGDWDEFTRDEDGSGGPLLPIVQPRNHTDAHEVDDIDGVAAAHDAKGNMTNDGAVAGNARTFAWDFDNRLTTVTMPDGRVHTYTYDALGRRVSKRVDLGTSQGGGPYVETVYICATHESGLGQVVAEYIKGQPATNPERHFVYGRYVDEPLILAREATRRLTGSSELTARTRFLSSLVYYHRNRKYDIVGITSTAGAVLERYTYTPYGEVTILDPTATQVRTVSAVDNPYAYTGRRWEQETGLYYFRARYYGPKLGRFLGRDPLGFVDGYSLYASHFSLRAGTDPGGNVVIFVHGIKNYNVAEIDQVYSQLKQSWGKDENQALIHFKYSDMGQKPTIAHAQEGTWWASSSLNGQAGGALASLINHLKNERARIGSGDGSGNEPCTEPIYLLAYSNGSNVVYHALSTWGASVDGVLIVGGSLGDGVDLRKMIGASGSRYDRMLWMSD